MYLNELLSNVKRKICLQRNSVEKIKFTRQRPVSTPATDSEILREGGSF